ncbi:hypothetical protein GNP73_13815 [Aliivibrio fischeri]|uniref:hypothetical protein n=1 Tax=Aliivibrio fischeri TaxID=668 RepID=UPI0012DAF302|nr:hypothetical protein [Aliivibrio fischeri]MUJ29048.1 hypothetical protein [Aliivibrio fischeri]
MKVIEVLFKGKNKKSFINVDVQTDKVERFELKYNDISDEMAIKLANGMQNDMGSKKGNSRSRVKNKIKECRVPGLYGCNRYKSNVNNRERSFS